MLVEYPKLEMMVSEKKTKKKTKSGNEKEYKYYVVYRTLSKSAFDKLVPAWFTSEPEYEKWYSVPKHVLELFEEIVKELVRDLASKEIALNISDHEVLSKAVKEFDTVAPAIIASLLARQDTTILRDYAFLGIKIDFDTEQLLRELLPLRKKLIELLKSNPLTKNVLLLDQSTEVGNMLVATSQLGTYSIKTYFIVEVRENKLVVSPVKIKMADFAEINTFLVITIDKEKALTARD